MKIDNDDELTMDKIEDYHGKESKEKRNIIWLVIIGGIVLGLLITYFRMTTAPEDPYIGTSEKPGIITGKDKLE